MSATEPGHFAPSRAPAPLGLTAVEVQGPDPSVVSRASIRESLLRRLLICADLLAGALGVACGAIAAGPGVADTAVLVIFGALAWAGMAFFVGVSNADDLEAWSTGVTETKKTAIAGLIASWPLFGVATALAAGNPELLVLVAVPTSIVFGSLARAAARALVQRLSPLRQRTIIVGSGIVAGTLVEKLRRHREFGLEPIGIVDDDPHTGGAPSLPVLGGIAALPDVVRLHAADRVIIAFSRASHEQLLSSIRACRDLRVAVDVVPRLFEFLDGARGLQFVGGLPVLSIGVPPLRRSARIAKRALDLFVSTGVLVALGPLFLAVALAIKIDSRGPVFFKQTRAGRHGRLFHVLKFRSMYADAEERKREFERVNDLRDGVMFKIHLDPRTTRVGRVLRRYSLDELPQLLNVVRGEMSLVGPRPLIVPETDALAEWQERRLELRPGLTGPWQISGRSDVPFEEMVRFDYQYVAGWSLARDIEILLATVPTVLSGRGAY
jgi:exopolysaccharide biosynthesis polyprenyl glycosylphosphotransferase